MKITAGVLTWNPIDNDRLALLDKTVASLAGVDRLVVFNNGSTDGFTAVDHEFPVDVETIDVPTLPGFPPGNTCGYGMNKIAATLDADILILSNDDILWDASAIPTLRAVWKEAPEDIAIISGLLEPTFALPNQEPWNQPHETLEVAGHKLLVRKSVPGGAWTIRGELKPLIFPVSTFPGVDDVPACHELNKLGFKVAALDLVEHGGAASTWGNASYERLIHTPLDAVKAKWLS